MTHVLVIALICTILSAALGAGVFKVLEIKVPEFLAIFSGQSEETEYESSSEFSEDLGTSSNEPFVPSPGIDMGVGEGVSTAVTGSDKPQIFGDHILVNKVKIKNEPKLMAQAIKTILSKDES